jgi:hypothetical protein
MKRIFLGLITTFLIFCVFTFCGGLRRIQSFQSHFEVRHDSTANSSHHQVLFDHRGEILFLYSDECSKKLSTPLAEITFLLKTFSGHLHFLFSLVDSLTLFSPNYELLFVADDIADGEKLIKHVPRSEFKVDKLGGKAASYFGQMWSNLWADIYSEKEIIAIMDSDMVLQLPLTR